MSTLDYTVVLADNPYVSPSLEVWRSLEAAIDGKQYWESVTRLSLNIKGEDE